MKKTDYPGGEHGCSWSESFEPVPGWDARRKDVLIGAKKDRMAESYKGFRAIVKLED